MQVGQAVQIGGALATIIDPDPMLAVGSVERSRRAKIASRAVHLDPLHQWQQRPGSGDFVGLSADKATRTYPVQAVLENPRATIPDGVTCEMTVTLAPTMATGVPRSALVFSDDGRLGVRLVTADQKASFVPVSIVDDAVATVWVTGLAPSVQIITVGQDFVRDGDAVAPVLAGTVTKPAVAS